MKKRGFVFLTAILTIGLVACNADNHTSHEDSSIGTDSTTVNFDGTIEEINGDSVLVAIDAGEILRSGDKVKVDLSSASDETFEIGDKIRVEYDGTIRESYPLQVNTLSIQKLD